MTGCSFIFSCSGSYQLAGTSGSGDTVIRCGVDGRWDYGDLRCISPLCTDPGTPPDATQVATSYEIGTEITYQCKRTGYAPSFSTPLRCQAVGNTVQWIPSTPPSCVGEYIKFHSNYQVLLDLKRRRCAANFRENRI